MSIGINELLLIAILVIILVRPEKLPEFVNSGRTMMNDIKNTSNSLKKDLDDTIQSMEQNTDIGNENEDCKGV